MEIVSVLCLPSSAFGGVKATWPYNPRSEQLHLPAMLVQERPAADQISRLKAQSFISATLSPHTMNT
eukprot:6488174-Amphidinium_carterae.1